MALKAEQTYLDKYADDSTICAIDENIDLVEQKLDSDIGNIINWFDDKIANNYDKTKDNILPVKEMKIKHKQKTLKNVKAEKLLGVVVDQKLSWNQHIDKVHKSDNMLLARFRHVKPLPSH